MWTQRNGDIVQEEQNRFTYHEFFYGGLYLFLNCGRENFGGFNGIQINSKNGDAVIYSSITSENLCRSASFSADLFFLPFLDFSLALFLCR